MTSEEMWRRTAMKCDGHSWNFERVKAWYKAGICTAFDVIQYGFSGFILASEVEEIIG